MPALPDTQSETDQRGLRLDRVGIRNLRVPLTLVSGTAEMATVGTFSLTADLPAEQRGTHMSRFVEAVHACEHPFNEKSLIDLTKDIKRRLHAGLAEVKLDFLWFRKKSAPVTGGLGWVDTQAGWDCLVEGRKQTFTIRLEVPISTVCPCSKSISERGAHNQRGVLRLAICTHEPMALDGLISLLESAGSCELFSLLKRADEKFVTERAYDNPVFVEDAVRAAAASIRKIPGLKSYRIEAENFESIHHHNAYAHIEG